MRGGWVQHDVFNAFGLDFLGQVSQFIQRVGADGYRRAGSFGQVGDLFPVGGVSAA
jgi:hypothetical protein